VLRLQRRATKEFNKQMEELERKRHEENAALDKKREQEILLLEAEYKE
jgi:hypothetical protein